MQWWQLGLMVTGVWFDLAVITGGLWIVVRRVARRRDAQAEHRKQRDVHGAV
jgi:hypothetical protein